MCKHALIISAPERAFLRPPGRFETSWKGFSGVLVQIISARPLTDLSPARVVQGLLYFRAAEEMHVPKRW